MDYEKKYNEALERARALNNGKDVDIEAGTTTWEYIFPELTESKDEKIRKEILEYFKDLDEHGYSTKEWISWLEKQDKTNPYSGTSFEYNGHTWGMCARDNGVDISLDGQLFKHLEAQGEKKSTNTKTKFHEGDWIVHNGVGAYKIIEVCESWYEVISYNDEIGIQYSIGFDKENDCRLWTIQDAKDGDVLVDKSDNSPFIFKGFNKHYPDLPVAYCGIDVNGKLITSGFGWWTDEEVEPATKKQRNLLFSKMKEAGYEWDSEKKELNNIEQKPADNVRPKFNVRDWIIVKGMHPALIVSINDDKYEIEFTDNGAKGFHPIDLIERHWHLWAVQDAKDGDVLVHGEQLFLFKRMNTSNSFYAHCNYHFTGYDNLSFSDCSYSIDNIHPATKEQCDRLEKAITEAGYRWNKEERKLEKI